LADERLRAIAERLLDIRYGALRELNSPFDDNFTRETTVFGRSRNMLIHLSLSGRYEWLALVHSGMDVTFTIDGIPCRFFRDDPEAPEKVGFFKRNTFDSLFSEDDSAPVLWRFVVEKALTEEDEDRVHFVGYNLFQDKVSEWIYSGALAKPHAVDREIPVAAEIPAPEIDVRVDLPAEERSKTGSNS